MEKRKDRCINMTAFYMRWESQFLLWIQEHLRTERLTRWMKRITMLGNGGMIWLLISVFLLVFRSGRILAGTVLMAQLFGIVITNLLLKNTVKRKRPYETIPQLEALLPPQRDWSFPSGHTTSSVSAGLLLLLHLPFWIGIPCMGIGLCIVWSRMYLGVHYPTDILGGMLIGSVCAITAEYFAPYIMYRFI
ncbi:MAG: phosphatase PAP2 family protein [Oscillospiraceae bacterium]|nr:phosphatase PAP2 family protein [Oscillospiraceae bacterium]